MAESVNNHQHLGQPERVAIPPALVERANAIKLYALGVDTLKEGSNDIKNGTIIGAAEEALPQKIPSESPLLTKQLGSMLREEYVSSPDKDTFLKTKEQEVRALENPLDSLDTVRFLTDEMIKRNDVVGVRDLLDFIRVNVMRSRRYSDLTKYGEFEISLAQGLTQQKPDLDIENARELVKTYGYHDRELLRSMGVTAEESVRTGLFSEKYQEMDLIKAEFDFGRVKYQPFESVPEGDRILQECATLLKDVLSDGVKKPATIKAVAQLITSLPFTYAKDILVEQIKVMDPADPNLPRLLREFATIDTVKAGKLSLNVLSSDKISSTMFNYLAEIFIHSDFLSQNMRPFINNPSEKTVLMRLLREHPFEVNTIVDSLAALNTSSLQKAAEPYTLHDHEAELFTAIQDLGSLTPQVFERYINSDEQGKRELISTINQVKSRLFRNIPTEVAVPAELLDIKEELVYLAYLPTGLSFEKASALMKKVGDCSQQLARFEIPQDGYDFVVAAKEYAPRAGESISVPKSMEIIKRMIAPEAPDTQRENILKALKKVANTTTDISPQELGAIVSLLPIEESVRQELTALVEAGPSAPTRDSLLQMKTVLTRSFDHGFAPSLSDYLKANQDVFSSLTGLLSNPSKLAQFKKQLNDTSNELDWDAVTKDERMLAEVLTRFISTSMLKPYQSELNKNIKKFMEVPGKKTNMKAHVSKSVPAFFSKGAVGLCTAEDIELFERNDYLQFTIVEGEKSVAANIQAYIYPEADGSQSLVLRGFNPSNGLLEEMNTPFFCEQVLELGRQFARGNGIKKLYITDQKRWAALSNKEGIASYMEKRYFKEEAKKQVDFPVTSDKRMDIFYEIPME